LNWAYEPELSGHAHVPVELDLRIPEEAVLPEPVPRMRGRRRDGKKGSIHSHCSCVISSPHSRKRNSFSSGFNLGIYALVRLS
jgi:hypothetical protein